MDVCSQSLKSDLLSQDGATTLNPILKPIQMVTPLTGKLALIF